MSSGQEWAAEVLNTAEGIIEITEPRTLGCVPDVCDVAYGASAIQRGRSPQWRELAKAWLQSHPVCEVCGTSEFLVVHHVKPFHLFPECECDLSNLMTLCETPSHSCHFVFGHLWMWTLWNEHIHEDAKWIAARRQFAMERRQKHLQRAGLMEVTP